MSLNCAVKLLRYDDILPPSKREDAVSVADNQANADVKRSVRISRKRTKPNIENGNQSDNIKNKDCNIKKPKLSKIEPGKTDAAPQKETKNTKIQDSSTKSCLINDDLSVTSGSTLCTNNLIENEKKIPTRRPLKPKPIKFKISKSIIAVRKKPIIHDVNKNNPSNELVKADNLVVPLKSPKTKTPKSNSSNRKKPVLSNVSKSNTSTELEESNSVSSIKTPNKSPKSITSNKKKSMNNIIVNAETQHELEINEFAVPQVPKSKTTKSIVSNKKKPAQDNTNKSDITNEHETSNKNEILRKRNRTSLKKEKSQKPDIGNTFNNEDSVNQTQNLDIICKTPYSNEGLKLSQNSDDNTMMLRSNNKPPKIKKKWSDEWSGGKSSTILSTFNNEQFSSESTLDVNSKKKISKSQKPKKVKTKALEEFNPNNPFVYFTPIPAYDNMDKITINVPVVQNDGISITYNVPFNESIPAVCNDTVSEPVGACNTLTNESSSNISIVHTTYTESTFSNNDQQSYSSTLDPISDSNYLLASQISAENSEMSYGMAILSEAISRQCRELENEKNIMKKPPEPNIIDTQSCSQKEISTLQSQVPSAKVSPQRVTKKVSRKKPKRPLKLGSQPDKNELEMRIERKINLLSKRFDIPSNYLKKTVVEEPLSVFHEKYSKSVTPSMVEISPIDVNSKSGLNVNYGTGNIDVEYKLEPIRESTAYETNNLKDLMLELSKTMPSWSLSIVTNPPRYVISHISINKYGVPSANKCIVLDRMFRASVYINQSLEHKFCKSYTTATEIVNLIKEINSI